MIAQILTALLLRIELGVLIVMEMGGQTQMKIGQLEMEQMLCRMKELNMQIETAMGGVIRVHLTP